jgi:beta-lactamase regulating signal transducer with metallopeptidase domain
MWAEYFVPAIVQNTVFLGLIFLLLHRFRNASAGVKYAIACVGLVKLLLPPFVPAGLFSGTTAESIQLPASTLLFSFTKTPVGAAATGGGSTPTLDVIGLLFLAWAVVTVVILAGAIYSTLRLASIVNHAQPVDATDMFTGFAPANIQVYKTERISMPMTIGVFPRRIFVPASWDNWTPECRDAVLRHELAHVQRRDGFFQALEIVAQALYFFHPMVLILNRRLREYREMACDDASVGRDRDSRIGYSRFLVEMAETALSPQIACESASTLLKRKNELLRRVAYQIKEGNMHFVSKKQLGVVLALLVVAILPFSFYMGATNPADQAVAGDKEKKQKEEQIKISSSTKEITVSLKGEKLLVDGKKISYEKFPYLMADISKATDAHALVNIECSKDVSMASVYKVHEGLKEAKLIKVKYSDGNGNALKMMLPTPDVHKKMEKVGKENILFVKIAANGTILIDDKHKVKPEKLTKLVHKKMQENPKLIVSIYMEGKTTYNDFVTTLASVQKSGADKVVINDPVI